MAQTRAMQMGRSTVDRSITPQAAAERKVSAQMALAAALDNVQQAVKDLMVADYHYSETLEAKVRAG